MKLEVPSNFLAPSSLDYSAYCRTAERSGFAADDVYHQACACLQEAKEWKKTGNFKELAPDDVTFLPDKSYWSVSPNKAALKFAIHSMNFLLCTFKNEQVLVACGYNKKGLLLCHPFDKKFGEWGKFYAPWSVVSKGLIDAFGVF